MKKLTLCADDFAINAKVSHGLLDLAQNRRLSAVSCMTNFPSWKVSGTALKEHIPAIKLGVHFNLGNTPMPLTLLRAYAHTLSFQKISDEIQQQIEAFSTVLGKLPDFIDGHEHIHQFPIIREALVSVYEKTYPEKTALIRCTVNHQPEFKARIIQYLGGTALQKLLQQHCIPHNTSFSGIYNFKNASHYREYFLRFLTTVDNGGLIMCHPGYADNTNDSRSLEYQYFSSETFLEDLRNAQVSIF